MVSCRVQLACDLVLLRTELCVHLWVKGEGGERGRGAGGNQRGGEGPRLGFARKELLLRVRRQVLVRRLLSSCHEHTCVAVSSAASVLATSAALMAVVAAAFCSSSTAHTSRTRCSSYSCRCTASRASPVLACNTASSCVRASAVPASSSSSALTVFCVCTSLSLSSCASSCASSSEQQANIRHVSLMRC